MCQVSKIELLRFENCDIVQKNVDPRNMAIDLSSLPDDLQLTEVVLNSEDFIQKSSRRET